MTRLKLFQCKDIPDRLVLFLAEKCQEIEPPFGGQMLADVLTDLHVQTTSLPETQVSNVVYAKINRLVDRGLLEYGVSPRGAWLTTEGQHQLNILLERKVS